MKSLFFWKKSLDVIYFDDFNPRRGPALNFANHKAPVQRERNNIEKNGRKSCEAPPDIGGHFIFPFANNRVLIIFCVIQTVELNSISDLNKTSIVDIERSVDSMVLYIVNDEMKSERRWKDKKLVKSG